MFRFTGSRLVSRTAALLNTHIAHEGFDFFESKVVDKDIHAPHENLEFLKLTLTRQDEFIKKEEEVKCVTIAGVNGESGIYPGHAYEIVKLAPSPITVEHTDGTIQRYFTSGGFAHINNVGSCDINTVECIPFSDLDQSCAEKSLAEQTAALGSAKDEKAKSVIEIRIGVLEAVIQALKQHSGH